MIELTKEGFLKEKLSPSEMALMRVPYGKELAMTVIKMLGANRINSASELKKAFELAVATAVPVSLIKDKEEFLKDYNK